MFIISLHSNFRNFSWGDHIFQNPKRTSTLSPRNLQVTLSMPQQWFVILNPVAINQRIDWKWFSIRNLLRDTPFATLDALYLQIFSSVEKDQLRNVLDVLSALILVKTCKTVPLEELLSYRSGQLEVMIDMVALVDIPTGRHNPVKIYHALLPRFLLDPFRSRNFLDLPQAFANLALQYLNFNREPWKFISIVESFDVIYSDYTDQSHLDLLPFGHIMECVVQSDPTHELIDAFLDFNPWPTAATRMRYTILVGGEVFLRWLKERASY